jgi:hypothetical protein
MSGTHDAMAGQGKPRPYKDKQDYGCVKDKGRI